MRTGFKRYFALLALLVAEPAFASAPAGGGACGGDYLGLGSMLAPITGSVKKSSPMSCQYQEAKAAADCRTCSQTVESWKEKIPKAAEAAGAADCAASTLGAGATAAAAGGTGTAQLSTFGGNRNNVAAGQRTQNTRAANADKARTEFEKCKQDIEKQCFGKRLSTPDQKIAGNMHKACEDAAKKSGQFADQKKQDGMGLGDIGKLMGLAQQAMGMAQQANQQQQPSDMSGLGAPSATSPTPGSGGSSTTPEIATTKLDGKDSTQAPTVGFGNVPGSSQVAAVQNGITGGGGTGASSGPEAFGGGGGAGLGAGASGGEVGSSGGGGAGGGGLGGGGNSSGASRPIDGLAGGAGGGSSGDGGGFEMNGGGGKAFVGLKASKAELDSVADGSLLGDNAPLDDLGARDPASEGGAIDAANEVDLLGSDSIFTRIKEKYSTLKGSGRI
jgi:hypothetical protein